MIKKYILSFLFLNGFFLAIISQENSFFYVNKSINLSDSGKLFIDIENNNYFKNNEYFGKFKKGYTAIGYHLIPRLTYYPGSKTKISSGILLQKFSGRGDKYDKAIPVFRIQHKLTPQIDIIMGELYGNLNHHLIEPIFEFDRYIYNYSETGLQFLFNSKQMQGDLWLNWEHFILWGDPNQEQLTVGYSGNHYLFKNKEMAFEIPFQGIVSHKGGQIDNSDKPIQNLTNLAPGLALHLYSQSTIKELIIQGYIPYYLEFSNQKQQAFKDGYGIYPSVFVRSNIIEFLGGYWKAYQFIGHRGEALFHSTSVYDTNYIKANRELLTAKLSVVKQFKEGIKIGLRTEYFYDLSSGNFEYNYGVYILFNERFFLKKLK